MSHLKSETALTRPKPRPTRVHWLTWRHIRLKVSITPHEFERGRALIELDAIASRDTPLPVSTTGYRAEEIETRAIKAAGGPLAYVTQWLDREAQSKTYRDREFRWRQGDLFALCE